MTCIVCIRIQSRRELAQERERQKQQEQQWREEREAWLRQKEESAMQDESKTGADKATDHSILDMIRSEIANDREREAESKRESLRLVAAAERAASDERRHILAQILM